MSELIFNLWAYYDSKTGYIFELSGKVYRVAGDDEFKLSLLDSLARTDYETAHRFKVPARYKINTPDGAVKNNLITFQMLTFQCGDIFEEVFRALELELPLHTVVKKSGSFKEKQVLPETPLTVVTTLYVDDKGNITPIITDEDREKAVENQDISNGSSFSFKYH